MAIRTATANIVELSGSATIIDIAGLPRYGKNGAVLFPGEILLCEANSKISVIYQNGESAHLSENTRLEFPFIRPTRKRLGHDASDLIALYPIALVLKEEKVIEYVNQPSSHANHVAQLTQNLAEHITSDSSEANQANKDNKINNLIQEDTISSNKQQHLNEEIIAKEFNQNDLLDATVSVAKEYHEKKSELQQQIHSLEQALNQISDKANSQNSGSFTDIATFPSIEEHGNNQFAAMPDFFANMENDFKPAAAKDISHLQLSAQTISNNLLDAKLHNQLKVIGVEKGSTFIPYQGGIGENIFCDDGILMLQDNGSFVFQFFANSKVLLSNNSVIQTFTYTVENLQGARATNNFHLTLVGNDSTSDSYNLADNDFTTAKEPAELANDQSNVATSVENPESQPADNHHEFSYANETAESPAIDSASGQQWSNQLNSPNSQANIDYSPVAAKPILPTPITDFSRSNMAAFPSSEELANLGNGLYQQYLATETAQHEQAQQWQVSATTQDQQAPVVPVAPEEKQTNASAVSAQYADEFNTSSNSDNKLLESNPETSLLKAVLDFSVENMAAFPTGEEIILAQQAATVNTAADQLAHDKFAPDNQENIIKLPQQQQYQQYTELLPEQQNSASQDKNKQVDLSEVEELATNALVLANKWNNFAQTFPADFPEKSEYAHQIAELEAITTTAQLKAPNVSNLKTGDYRYNEKDNTLTMVGKNSSVLLYNLNNASYKYLLRHPGKTNYADQFDLVLEGEDGLNDNLQFSFYITDHGIIDNNAGGHIIPFITSKKVK